MKRILPIISVLALAAGGGAFWWYQRDHDSPAQELTLYGNIDIRQVQLAFNAAERIKEMRATEGTPVNRGQLLASLDTQRLEQNVKLREAQAEAQRQQLARLQAGSRPEEIRKARADVAVARSDAGNAQRAFERLDALVKQRFIARQQADNAQAAADAAKARLQAAQESLRLAELGPRREDISAARANLQASEAAVALARRDLSDAALYAPADGIIQDRILEPGDMASPQRPVYTLALTDPLWVRAYAPGPSLGLLRPGIRAEVTTDSFPDKRYRAWIGFISPTAEFTPKAVETTEVRAGLVYQVRVFVCNPNHELRLGMPATVRIPLGQAPLVDAEHCQQP